MPVVITNRCRFNFFSPNPVSCREAAGDDSAYKGPLQSIAQAFFSVTGMGCTTEFKKSPYDGWDEDDIDELDSPADEVEFMDGPDAEDLEEIDGADPDAADMEEEEPATIVCGKIGPDVKLSNAAESFVNPSLGWSGSGFAVAYDDADEVYFGSLSPAGSPINWDVSLTDAWGMAGEPALAFDGGNFGLAWFDGGFGPNEIMFMRVSQTGGPIGADQRVTNAGDSRSPSIEWTGRGWGVSWHDNREGNNEIYFAALSDVGALLSSNIRVTDDWGNSQHPSLVWTGSEFGIFFHDDRHGGNEIFLQRVSELGGMLGSAVRVTDVTGDSSAASAVWTGSEFAVAWQDNAEGNFEINLARLSALGAMITASLRMTNDPAESTTPSFVWTGSELAFAWSDSRIGDDYEIFLQRVSADGFPTGGEIRITEEVGESANPSLVWTGSEYGVSWNDDRDGDPQIYFARAGCWPE
jgi:hypothetical protein